MQWLSVPSINGDASVGAELSLTQGGWTEVPIALSYVWTSNGDPIAGAGDATYTVAAEDTGRSLACRVTAVGSDGGITVATSAVVIAA